MRLSSCGFLAYANLPLGERSSTRNWAPVFPGSLLAAGVLGQCNHASATTVPAIAAGTYYLTHSTNWGGYADVVSSGSSDTFTAVSGQWTVPTVQEPPGTSSGAYSAFWVGLDGFNSNTVEQTGVEAQISGGTATYYAWYEMYPASEVEVFTVSPGDTISASVTYDGTRASRRGTLSAFTLAITDMTSGQSSSITQSLLGTYARTSAEWIAEAPTIQYYNGTQSLSTLADFGSVTFTNASATLAGSISGLPSTASVNSIEMVKQNSAPNYIPLAIPSALSNSGSTFTVTYVPEPTSLALLLLSITAIPLLRRRKSSR